MSWDNMHTFRWRVETISQMCDCNKIVHMLCAVTDPNSDAWTCKECDSLEDDSSRTETYNGLLTGSEKEKSMSKSMTVSVDHANEEFTEITKNVNKKSVEQITKDYCVIKHQRVNKDMKNMDPEWDDLRARVNKIIDSALKEEMVVEA